MKFVDVILPLPLEGYFTYAIPENMETQVVIGGRMLVPLGRSKKYVAVAVRLHNDKPDFKTKEIIEILDKTPIITVEQLELWKWIAYYYLSPIGEVYHASMPQGLKTTDVYRPKTESCLALAPNLRSEQALHEALQSLARAQKRQQVFADFLHLSHWDSIEGNVCRKPLVEITRDELMNSSHASAQIIKTLVDKRFLIVYEREIGRLNHAGEANMDSIKPLSAPQQEAYNQILFHFLSKKVVLLHGITSSGKTEIYIHLIQQAIERKEQVLYLLPEIALTVQMRERLQKVFGNRLGIYHSKYSDAERVEIWKKQLSTHPYDIILGARSAVFLPFRQLGLVIVDEEHETSFKQQEPAPRYHARSAAIMLAQMFGARTLLGTATPSAESYYNALTGKYGLVELSTRYQDIQLPQIQVVDIKDLQRRKLMNGPFSPLLLSSVRNALEQGGQAILFQNRRGFAPMVECKTCGWVPHCTNCDVSLTHHKNTNQLSCHYCGYTYQIPSECPNCGSSELIGRGYGTEKIENRIMEIFPEAKVARMDLDTTRTRSAYERILNDFSTGKTNLLIGTQMISKGLDFDHVSVVGILNADNMLNYPDFRAYEHAFMMMSQVSGRAGRKGKRGLVILQTKSPDLPIVGQVVRNDYKGFLHDLLEERSLFHYPPYYHLVYVFLKSRHEKVSSAAAVELGSLLRQWFGTRVLGPDKPAVARIKTMHIRKIVLKLENGIDMKKVREYLRYAQEKMLHDIRFSSLQIYYDADPL